MTSLRRILAVTIGLTFVGIVAGGLAAAFGWAISALLTGHWQAALNPAAWGFTAIVGAFFGAVAAPVTSWIFLRHVPIGKVIYQTTVATALLSGIAFALKLNPFFFALVGFLGAAMRLALVTPDPTWPPAQGAQGKLKQ